MTLLSPLTNTPPLAIGLPQTLAVIRPATDPLPPLDLPRSEIWGLSLARLSLAETVDAVDRLIARRKPSYFITANLHYAMLSDGDPRVRDANRRAAFLVADGMPMVWYARFTRRPLPERVTGADLLWHLCARAALAGHRVFLMGGAEGVAQQAGAILARRYPGLQIAGTLAPPHRPWTAEDNRAIVASVRRARTDLLIAALGQPKGELWLADHVEPLGVPACVQVGASLDFIVGRARRAPRWLQRAGLEWLFRAFQEPKRLGPRYFANALFLAKAIARDLWRKAVA